MLANIVAIDAIDAYAYFTIIFSVICAWAFTYSFDIMYKEASGKRKRPKRKRKD